MRLTSLSVGLLDVPQGYVFVAIAGVGVLLAGGEHNVAFLVELYRALRAVLYARETGFALAFGLDSRRCEAPVAVRTYVGAHAAAYARVGGGEALGAVPGEAFFGVYACRRDKALVLLPLFLRDRFYPAAPCRDVGGYAGEAFWYVLVYFYLLVHVEVGQPVVDHNHRCDVVEGIAGTTGYVVPYLGGVALTVAVGKYGELILGLKPCLFMNLRTMLGGMCP